ncbi:MAG: glycosyltransferase family 39 protein [Pirellulales bacterium]|nr:glycosyltransferase family 39 protein [Pirellulales bacterium]
MRRLLVLLLLIVLAAKVAATLARGPVPIEQDAGQYWRLSSLVMSGDVLMVNEPIAYRTPLYPYFLAFVRLCGGQWALPAIIIIQGLLHLASLFIAAYIAARITKLPAAMTWTLVAALPAVSALTFVATTLSETLFLFFLMLNLLAVLDYAKFNTKGRAIWLGVTFALALLTRPIVLLLWLAHVGLLLWIDVRRKRRLRDTATPNRVQLHHRLGHGLIAAAIIFCLAAPWLTRNYHLFGKPFLTEFVGRNVWVVTFQDGSGAGLQLPPTKAGETLQRRLANVGGVDDWRMTWQVSNALVASGLSDSQADQLMKQVAWEAMSNHRKTFAWKTFRRVVNFWRCAATDLPQQSSPGDYRQQQTWQRNVPPIDWALRYRLSQSVWGNTALVAVLALATLLLLVNTPTRPYAFWLLLIFSYFAVVTGALEIPAYRYRIVIEPLAAATIGAAIAVALSWRRKPVALEAAS